MATKKTFRACLVPEDSNTFQDVTADEYVAPFREAHDLIQKLMDRLNNLPLKSFEEDDENRRAAAVRKAKKLHDMVEVLQGFAMLRAKEWEKRGTDAEN